MPSPWAMIDNSFPTFTGKESYREQVGALQDYLYLVVEELKYQLSNLNAQNWNKTALTKLQKDTVAETDEQVESLKRQISTISARLNALAENLGKLTERTEAVETEIPKLWEGLELIAGDVDTLGDIVRSDGEGGAIIGAEGKTLRLLGNVYINGVLVKEEENGTA